MGLSKSFSEQDINNVITLVSSKKTIGEILRETGLSKKQFESVLCSLRKEYDYRVYKDNSPENEILYNKPDYIIKMQYNDKIETVNYSPLKLLICSDMHLCSQNDRPDLIDAVWNFAVKKGIKHIINLGDVTEGTEYYTHKTEKSKIKIVPNLEFEMSYLNKYIPFDKDITHHVMQGNHDQFSSNGISIDLINELKSRYSRPDIITTGMDNAILSVNNDIIHLLHRSFFDFVEPYLQQYQYSIEKQIMFCGHAHQSSYSKAPGYNVQYIPPLSDLPRQKTNCKVSEHTKASKQKFVFERGDEFFTGFAVVFIYFDNRGYMSEVCIEKNRFLPNSTEYESYFCDDIPVRRFIA